eukprot:TRINITY_DN58410_c0_g1_i1.p1 TRINITY_DN58410_c0_g1~~TRINITY_DN58410_c0_g1_i1.p1  ORF type:complete len:373 (+),score=48.21 TRINITY_DN58410_c0_g1_i1:87-1205(+)
MAAAAAAVAAVLESGIGGHRTLRFPAERLLENVSFGETLANVTTSTTALTGNLSIAGATSLRLVPPLASMAVSTTSAPQDPGCQLLSTKFGWWLQAVLGFACFMTLVGKRFTDRVRRPWKIWFFDTSKQGISALVVHFLNILLSMAFGEFLNVNADPCNWYWINLTLDDTLGVAIQFLLLRSLQCIYRCKCVNRPELARSGDYGDPPECRIYGRQLLDWQGLIVVQKCLLGVLVVRFSVQVTAVADVLLGLLDSQPRAKLVVVMVITPLTMNVFALWVADNFMKSEQAQSEEAQAKERLVPGSSPAVMGNRGGRAQQRSVGGDVVAKNVAGVKLSTFADDISDHESNRVIGFEEWKRKAAAFGGNTNAAYAL